MTSKMLLNGFDKFQLDFRSGEDYFDFVQYGFLSILESIEIGVCHSSRETMDTTGFIRAHVKHGITALKYFKININDKTNIEALADILACSPKSSSFTITFNQSSMTLQNAAEKCWKLLLSVSYSNKNDKTVTVYLDRDFMFVSELNQEELEALDWSFTKETSYKQYQNVRDPGTVKNLVLGYHLGCAISYSYAKMFYTMPIWNQLSIENFTTPMVSSFEGQLSTIAAKCVKIQHNGESVPRVQWTYFSNCEKLEIYFERMNEEEEKIMYHDLLKLIKHPNLHVSLGEPIKVSDVNVEWDPTLSDEGDWVGSSDWTLYDAESFVNRIAVSSIKTVTYKLCYYSKETVTFNCDERFPFSFMEFLETQPIYSGNNEEFYLTLEEAKDSFPNYPYF